MQLKTKINGETWTCRLVSAKEMKAIYGKDKEPAAAFAWAAEKTIYVDWDEIEFSSIAHELVHAYWADLHLDDTNSIPLADIEEIVAGFIAAKGERLLRQARKLTKKLKALADA